MSGYDDTHDSSPSCTKCCAGFILTLGLTSLFMWLSLRTSNPILSIQDIYIPALNTTLNSRNYTKIYIDLKLDNVNKDKGVHYDQLNVTLQYYKNSTTSDVNTKAKGVTMSNYTIQGFYQGHKKNARRKLWVDTYDNVTWDDVKRVEVDLKTAIRFKILFWNTKRHKQVLQGEFEVDNVGKKVSKKGTRLKSGASELFSGEGLLLVVFSSLFLVLI